MNTVAFKTGLITESGKANIYFQLRPYIDTVLSAQQDSLVFVPGVSTKGKTGLLKKIATATRFRDNARSKEKIRIEVLIDSLQADSSLSINNTILLINSNKLNKDSMLKQIISIKQQQSPVIDSPTGKTPAASTGNNEKTENKNLIMLLAFLLFGLIWGYFQFKKKTP